ncbi:hypothetical protein ASG36_18830 [Geodermatophilus sp. Leaf369]|uniref:esterase-like activity of phytase family protein n=1 Tax=Geodermatophilus sp. Leaf369 TaxID=1736354 RepID=UPI0006F99A97|nr:esterase-like activity of phytase family protein [Geodermatophilus sp. Leaf369]KQS57040.1 hypothetical protein ASG36_18830 [Geodermatophilus sp. Leaf369]
MTSPRRRCGALLTLTALAAGTAALTAPTAGAAPGDLFTRTATYPVFQNSGLGPDAEAVAEISATSPDGRTVAYTDAANGFVGFLDISDPSAPVGRGVVDVGGEPTSVVYRGGLVLVCVDDTDGAFAAPSGRLVVLDAATRTVVREIDLGGQPDSIALRADGGLVAIAMENQRDEDVADGELPQLPAGTLTLLDVTGPVAGWTPATVDLVDALTGIGAYGASDPEPEYVAFAPDGTLALSLQENNAVAVITPATDLAASTVRAFDAGSVTVSGVDTEDDDSIDPTGTVVDAPREPDAIAWVGDGLLATANEGDLVGGTRGWTVFDTATGDVVHDSGNELDRLAIQLGLYPDSRSDAKGVEPEGLSFGTYGGVPYAFVGSERGNFVAVYDMSDPTEPAYLQTLPTTNGPEGLLPIPSRGLFVVSSETDVPEDDVRASVQLYSLGAGPATFPTIASLPGDPPVAWGALSGLTAVPGSPGLLNGVSDSAYAPATITTIDTTTTPATVRASLPVTSDTPLDLEGIAARADGGWWVVSEGNADDELPNQLVRLDAAGVVAERVALPAEVQLGNRGLEGVTIVPGGGPEVLWVALQTTATGDPEGVSRLGRYDTATGTWSWVGYRQETPPAGSAEGVSEVVAVDADTLAVVERDDRPGVFAAVKRVYTVELAGVTPAATGAPLPIAPKTLAVDLLPLLAAGNGWVQEKVEGLAIGGDGQLYAVTDNDGVSDATGETVFLRLGAAAEVFPSAAPAPTPTPTPAPGPVAGGPAAPPQLADTGASVGGLGAVAALLLLAGGGAVVAGRRSRA